jgi:inward rectifier potassium channel
MNEQPHPPGHHAHRPRDAATRFVKETGKIRRAVVKGQDSSRWRDIYHAVLTAPWWLFFLGLLALFGLLNAVFATFYVLDPGGIDNARPGSFWDAYLFSVRTIGSVASPMMAKSTYVNVVVSFEAFFGVLYMALVTGAAFAKFSKPFSRIVFSKVAVITPFDGVPTLMFRAANQRGNQILDAGITVNFARQVVTKEGIAMRRFEELPLVRSRSPLFALSWTILHKIDEKSPLYGKTLGDLFDMQMELLILLSGTDDTLADVIYARHSYTPDEILVNRRFTDVLSMTPSGRRVVDLGRFHDTEPLSP